MYAHPRQVHDEEVEEAKGVAAHEGDEHRIEWVEAPREAFDGGRLYETVGSAQRRRQGLGGDCAAGGDALGGDREARRKGWADGALTRGLRARHRRIGGGWHALPKAADDIVGSGGAEARRGGDPESSAVDGGVVGDHVAREAHGRRLAPPAEVARGMHGEREPLAHARHLVDGGGNGYLRVGVAAIVGIFELLGLGFGVVAARRVDADREATHAGTELGRIVC